MNLFFVILIILSYISPLVSPLDFSPLAFLGLIYPFLLLINLFFVVFWILRKSKIFIISLLSILIGINFITNLVHFNFNKEQSTHHTKTFKVLSYNVRVFNLWNWSPESNRPQRIFDFIRKSNSNIVCLQEFYSKKESGRNAEDSILSHSQLKHSHIVYNLRENSSSNYGIATFTSYPIVSKGIVQMNKQDNYCIYSDILIEKDTLRIYNIHLASIHLGEKDYHLIENLNSDDTIDVKGIRNIYWKFKKSYKKRALQVNTIVKHISGCKYPIILCGDFNDTPFSFVYRQLTNNLTDAFRISGNGIGYTYINKYPAFRIDYILHSARLKSHGFRSEKVKLSDHYPVECYFEN